MLATTYLMFLNVSFLLLFILRSLSHYNKIPLLDKSCVLEKKLIPLSIENNTSL